MSKFKTVPDALRDTLRPVTKLSRFHEEVESLIAGKTIFIAGAIPTDGTPNNIRTNLNNRSHGTLRLVTRQAFVDGESGIVMWAVPKEPVPA